MKILDEIRPGVWIPAFLWTTVDKDQHKSDYTSNKAHHQTPEAALENTAIQLTLVGLVV